MTAGEPLSRSFLTGAPATLQIDVAFGSVEIVTGVRETTTVVIRPADDTRRADVDLARDARVDYLGGVVSVATARRVLGSVFRPGAIAVVIEAPARTEVRADVGYATFVADGDLGRCQVRSSYGDIRLGEADDVDVKTSGGSVLVGLVRESATIRNSYAAIRVGAAYGRCDLRNSMGDVSVGIAAGQLAVRSAYGEVSVERAIHGSVDIVTSYGASDVAVAAGTVARVDVHTKHGAVHNALLPTGQPAQDALALDLRVRSGWGGVTIRRAPRPVDEGNHEAWEGGS